MENDSTPTIVPQNQEDAKPQVHTARIRKFKGELEAAVNTACNRMGTTAENLPQEGRNCLEYLLTHISDDKNLEKQAFATARICLQAKVGKTDSSVWLLKAAGSAAASLREIAPNGKLVSHYKDAVSFGMEAIPIPTTFLGNLDQEHSRINTTPSAGRGR